MENFSNGQRKRERIRRVRHILDNMLQLVFFILLMFFTVYINGERMVDSYIVLIPESFSFLSLVFLSRWPDNPCSSLIHLL